MSSASTALVNPPSKVRAKITNSPAERHGRSAEARRVRDLFESYSAALGYPADVATQALILSAAEHITIAERTRAGVIAGEVAPTEAVRTQGAADRALRRIGLNKPATSKPAGPSLAQIRARYANTPSTPATSEAGG